MDGWYGGRGNSIYNMVKDMKKRGCPIHGVGFQLHEDIDFAQHTSTIAANLKRYDDLGIKVHFTEVDVKGKGGWSKQNLDKQNHIYMQLLYICLKAPNCESFETWGFTDKYSWMKSPANPLPFTKEYRKKDAFYVMRDLMRDWDRNDAATVERNKRRAQEAQ